MAVLQKRKLRPRFKWIAQRHTVKVMFTLLQLCFYQVLYYQEGYGQGAIKMSRQREQHMQSRGAKGSMTSSGDLKVQRSSQIISLSHTHAFVLHYSLDLFSHRSHINLCKEGKCFYYQYSMSREVDLQNGVHKFSE